MNVIQHPTVSLFDKPTPPLPLYVQTLDAHDESSDMQSMHSTSIDEHGDMSSDEGTEDTESELEEQDEHEGLKCTNIAVQDDDDEGMHRGSRTIRLPTSFSHRHNVDRRVSSASQRGASQSKASRRPAPISLKTSTHAMQLAPRIEVEQVYDDADDEQEPPKSLLEPTSESSPALRRQEARTRMMQAIGRTRVATLRRSESMDVVVGRESDSNKEGSPSPTPPVSAMAKPSPAPRTPGMSFHHHQRSASCPTPLTPQQHQFGEFQVIVTPPTPRPQGSPIIGVFIKGVHSPSPTATHFCASTFAQSDEELRKCYAACKQCQELTALKVPEFELAPGRAKLIQAQREQSLALLAWKHQQQLQLQGGYTHHLADWRRGVKSTGEQSLSPAVAGVPLTSPVLIPGTPLAPSMSHVQEMNTMHQRHRQKTAAVSATAAASFTPPASAATAKSGYHASWWREPDSAPSCWTGSSASMYSQGTGSPSAMTSVWTPGSAKTMQTEANKPPSPQSAQQYQQGRRRSVADSATSWRRGGAEGGNDETVSASALSPPIRSAPLTLSSQSTKRDAPSRAYVPPGRRALATNA